MLYYAGWVFIFVLILYLIHKLSNHTKEILLWTLKVSIALYVTCGLAFVVYVAEHFDVNQLNTVFKTATQQVNDIRNGQL